MSQNPYFFITCCPHRPDTKPHLHFAMASGIAKIFNPFQKIKFCHLDLYPILENKLGRDYVDSFLSKTTLRDVMLRELQMPFR
jgi:hypothetical protein